MDKTIKLFASLKELGISPKMETFIERKKVQKTVYLLDKTFGLNFGYSYNWYLHGPYSPEVTKIIYGVLEGESRQNAALNHDCLPEEDLEKIKRMKAFLGDDLNSTDELELLASIQFLLDCIGKSSSRDNEIIAFLNEKKPYFSIGEIKAAIQRLRRLESQ